MSNRSHRRRAPAGREPAQGHPQRARRRAAAGAEGRRRAARRRARARTSPSAGRGAEGLRRARSSTPATARLRALPRRDLRPGRRRAGQVDRAPTTSAPPPPRMGKDLLPRVAARLKAAMATDVIGFDGAGADVTFNRPMWAGNVIAEVKLTTPVKVFTVRATEFRRGQKAAAAGRGEGVRAEPRASREDEVRRLQGSEERAARADRGAGGRLRRPRHQGRLQGDRGAGRRARRARSGASRAVCDAGWVPNDCRSARPARWWRPSSTSPRASRGAIQHLAGMKGSKTIVAINKDPEAPIFQVADYGLVADLFKVLPELRAAIQAARSRSVLYDRAGTSGR